MHLVTYKLDSFNQGAYHDLLAELLKNKLGGFMSGSTIAIPFNNARNFYRIERKYNIPKSKVGSYS